MKMLEIVDRALKPGKDESFFLEQPISIWELDRESF
jgi:hypothetical protein